MAKSPTKSQGARTFNIIDSLRGNFTFRANEKETPPPSAAYPSPELISRDDRTKLLQGNLDSPGQQRQPVAAGSLINIVQGSLVKVGKERMENRKILGLMPEVDKAARLMIASTLSPNDLTRDVIPVVFNNTSILEGPKKRLEKYAEDFFQKKINLKTQLPSWMYQYGYETGSCIFAIIPMTSFDKIQDESYIGTEDFSRQVIDPLAQESLFNFGDAADRRDRGDVVGLESLAREALLAQDATREQKDKSFVDHRVPASVSTSLVEKIIGQEALSLTDNPSVLRVQKYYKNKSEKKTKNTLKQKFKLPMHEAMVSLSLDDADAIGNPILMRLPPESVTVIHTPGDPNDHQGYLVMLDQLGNPINAVAQEEAREASPNHYNNNHQSVFQQTYNAYGVANGTSQRTLMDHETMSRVYTQIVSEHLKRRLGKAGFNHVQMESLDSVYRCMFSRFLQQKQTRILFLPKELVTYMAFERNDQGYGVSRLDRIKFVLGMKMSLQVSRILAAIKNAMDKRKIDVKFDPNYMDQPEAMFTNIINEYIKKQTINFAIDPSAIQSQIADKSISIKGSGIPGMEEFDITNEPDTRSGTVDIDPDLMAQLDKTILNGLRVPASTMNSLSEDEYARSVTTTNLFFAMDVAIDQEIVIGVTSDLLRKYAQFSEEFQKGLLEILPQLGREKISASSTNDPNVDDNGVTGLPDDYTLEMLIADMSIALPHPNVAPGKAQFEALEAMVTAIQATVTALLPDDIVGSDETLRPALTVLRARYVIDNIRNYLKSSGMSSLVVPENEVSKELGPIRSLHDSLYNLAQMMKDNAALGVSSEEPTATPSTSPEGY
jgi:hypothetical protein